MLLGEVIEPWRDRISDCLWGEFTGRPGVRMMFNVSWKGRQLSE